MSYVIDDYVECGYVEGQCIEKTITEVFSVSGKTEKKLNLDEALLYKKDQDEKYGKTTAIFPNLVRS